MNIRVKGFGDMKRFLNDKPAVELKDEAKMSDLILFLGGKVRASGIALLGGYKVEDSSLVVLVNGRNIHALEGYDTVLREGDLVSFMPVLIGG